MALGPVKIRPRRHQFDYCWQSEEAACLVSALLHAPGSKRTPEGTLGHGADTCHAGGCSKAVDMHILSCTSSHTPPTCPTQSRLVCASVARFVLRAFSLTKRFHGPPLHPS